MESRHLIGVALQQLVPGAMSIARFSNPATDLAANATDPEIRRLLGSDGDLGKLIGLDKDWAGRVLKAVGNYGEMYERNVGSGSKLQIPRGMNQLWNAGGIQYAPPIR